jgi:hypothetical protein
MTLAEALRSILKDYKIALTAASGATAATERSAPSSEGEGHKTKVPRDFGSEAREIEQLVIRVARLVRVRLAALRHIPGLTEPRFDEPTDRRHPIRKATREVVLSEEGIPAVEVAWLYGIREDYVERIRREAKRDPKTGERRDTGAKSEWDRRKEIVVENSSQRSAENE